MVMDSNPLESWALKLNPYFALIMVFCHSTRKVRKITMACAHLTNEWLIDYVFRSKELTTGTRKQFPWTWKFRRMERKTVSCMLKSTVGRKMIMDNKVEEGETALPTEWCVFQMELFQRFLSHGLDKLLGLESISPLLHHRACMRKWAILINEGPWQEKHDLRQTSFSQGLSVRQHFREGQNTWRNLLIMKWHLLSPYRDLSDCLKMPVYQIREE